MALPHQAVFVTKEAYLKYGLFKDNLKIAMDYDLLLRLFTNGANFFKIKGVLANFREGGLSNKNFFKSLVETNLIHRCYLKQKINISLSTLYLFYLVLLKCMGRFK
jgi:hypothetical protein